MKILTADEMRQTDQATTRSFGISMATLMENAGAAVARFVRTQYASAQRITVVCGTGNNGGDGFVAARHLSSNGLDVAVLLLGEESKLHGEAADMYSLLHHASIALFGITEEAELSGIDALLAGADLIVDAVVGTGFKPPLRGIAIKVRDRLNALKMAVVAVDLPSGWDTDSQDETVEGAFRADAVVTFTAPKTAHVFGHLTQNVFGPVVVSSIGSPEEAIVSTQNLEWAADSKKISEMPRPINANKGRFGHLLVVGGSLGKSGAAAMASLSALRAGAGLVTAAVPRSSLATVAAIAPELMSVPLAEDTNGAIALNAVDQVLQLAETMKVLAIGPGLSTEGEVFEAVRRIVDKVKLPTVLDADGLNAFAGKTDLLHGGKRPLILTPHPGEMARLLGISVKEVEADRINLARSFSTKHQLTLVLKGWRTLIAHPDGTVAVNTSGNPSMAKGGSGDILTGIIAAMVAQYADDLHAAVNAAVYLHGLAADFAVHRMDEHTVLATDTIAHLSDAFRYRTEDVHGFTWIAGLHATENRA